MNDNDKLAPAAPDFTQTHTVVSGDTLGKIARKYYGDAALYMTIFDANKDQLQAAHQDLGARLTDMAGVEALLPRLHRPDGPGFASIQIAADEQTRVLPPRDGVFLKTRFRESLGLKPI